MKSNKIKFYWVSLYMSWDYRAEGPMFTNGGANCQVPGAGITPWFHLQKAVFYIKTKNPMHLPEKKVGIFPTLGLQTSSRGGPNAYKLSLN